MYDDSERPGLTTVSQFVPRFFLSVAISAALESGQNTSSAINFE